MHIHNQQDRVELNGLIQSQSALGFQKTETVQGYRNGLSVALKNMKKQTNKMINTRCSSF
jgi:hypothetical protein